MKPGIKNKIRRRTIEADKKDEKDETVVGSQLKLMLLRP